jgi:hypothetical protein
MTTTRQLTAIIERVDDAYVALCPELDIASQGETVEAARGNLVEALELFSRLAIAPKSRAASMARRAKDRDSLEHHPSIRCGKGAVRAIALRLLDSHTVLIV